MGAVLHTLNIRLFPDQVTYVANHAEDKVVIVDASLLAPFAALLPTFETVTPRAGRRPEAADADLSALEATGKTILRYEDALAAAEPVTRLARHRRDRRRRDVLHLRHHRQPQGRGLQPPLDVPALDGRRHGRRDGADAVRPDPADRADVPRQRLGPAVRRDHGRRRDGDAGPLAPVRAADAVDRGRAGRPSRARSRRSGTTSSPTPTRTRPTSRPSGSCRAVAPRCRWGCSARCSSGTA